MVCPNCGYRADSGVGECPRCAEPLTATRSKAKKRTWTITDIIEGILFPLLGLLLLVLFVPRLLQTAGNAVNVITGTPLPGNLDEVRWAVGAQVQTAPTVLNALSNLMWSLAGLFLLIAGFMSLAFAKGRNQATSAVVLMLFGFVADVAALFLIGYRMGATSIPALLSALGIEAWFYPVQIAVIVVSLVLISLKQRAQKKQKFKRAAESAQALQAARMKAATRAAAAQPTPGQNVQAAASSAPSALGGTQQADTLHQLYSMEPASPVPTATPPAEVPAPAAETDLPVSPQ